MSQTEDRRPSPEWGGAEAVTVECPEELRHELLTLVYEALPIVLAANLVNGTLVAAVFADDLPPAIVFGWYGLLLAMVAVRIVLWRRFQRQQGRHGTYKRWRLLAVLGSGASGVLWGVAGAIFGQQGGETGRMVMSFVLGGMGAGTVGALAPVLPVFYAFLFPAILPFTLSLVLVGGTPHTVMAGACIMYLIGIVVLGRRANRWLTQYLLLRLERVALVRSLEQRVQQRTEELEAINARLSVDIADRRRAEVALEQYGNRQSAVAAFGERALSGMVLDTLFAEALGLVRQGLNVQRAAILEHPSEGRGFSVRMAVEGTDSISGELLPEGYDSPAGYALMTRRPIVSANLANEMRFSVPPILADSGAVSVLDVVIAGGRRPFGVLEASDHRPRDFGIADISFVESIANMLAAAIDRKTTERDNQQLALRDPLTGLPNRSLFHDQLLQALARVSRSGETLAVLLLDLDYFKDVNDSLGHSAGDRLLVDVAGRLRACIRQSEPPARLGGDEFALILTDLQTGEAANIAATVAQKITDRLTDPFLIDGQEIHIGVSIGITLCPGDGERVDDLMRNADLALYRAKSDRRGSYRFYSVEMSIQIERRKAIEADLRRAVTRQEFDLLYQPQVDLATNRVVGAEALLRWRHPTRGLLQPDEFLAVAETSGLLAPIGTWVLETACRHACECHRAGLPAFTTAVNVSPGEFRGDDLAETVERIASRLGCELSWLELEVTEQMFHPPERSTSLRSLVRLRSLGVTVSIDDFGTGYSNLARLHALPVDRVKIDRTYIANLGQTRDAELIVRAMISLAINLGLGVVAEGVETEAQLAFLRAEGCHRAQGFRLSPPRPFDAFVRFLSANALADPVAAGDR